MLTKAYWVRLAEDVWTGFLVGSGGAVLADGFNVYTADWKAMLGLGLTGAIVAAVKAALATPVGAVDSPRVK